jgi:hypothetical protein
LHLSVLLNAVATALCGASGTRTHDLFRVEEGL